MAREDEKLVVYKGTDVVATGNKGTGEAEFAGLEAGTKIENGTYQVSFKNETEESNKVDVPEAMVTESTMTLPLVEFTGDVSKLDENKTKAEVDVKYTDLTGKYSFTSKAKINWQGMSSISYPKKNYALKLYSDDSYKTKNKIQVNDDWYATHAYVLKADWVDTTHARNIIGVKLWKQIMQDPSTVSLIGSEDVYKRLASTKMYGTVDGFPCEVRINGEFMGLYTFDLDNTTSMTGVTDADTKAIQMNAKGWGNVTMGWDVNAKLDGSDGDFELEAPDDTDATAFQNAKTAVYNWIAYTQFYGLDSFKSQWGNGYNIYNVIDYGLFMNFMNAQDNMCNNVGYISLDSTKFFLMPYDMDGVFDLTYGGQTTNSRQGWEMGTVLLRNAFLCYPDAAVQRWNDLSKNVFTKDNIMSLLNDFKNKVGDYGYTLDNTLWNGGRSKVTYQQIEDAIDDGLKFMDDQVNDGFKIVARQYANGNSGGYGNGPGTILSPNAVTATATSDGATIKDGELYANRDNQSFVLVDSKGQTVSQSKGGKSITLTGLAAGTAVKEGDYSVFYQENDKTSDKVKVPAFTVPTK